MALSRMMLEMYTDKSHWTHHLFPRFPPHELNKHEFRKVRVVALILKIGVSPIPPGGSS